MKNLDSILSSTVTVSSIVIAFLGTTMSILISLTNAEVMKRIKKQGNIKDLTSYIRQAIIAGLLLAIYSMFMYMYQKHQGVLSRYLLSFFVLLLIFFVSSSFRIFNVIFNILSSVLNEDKNEEDHSSQKKVKPTINSKNKEE